MNKAEELQEEIFKKMTPQQKLKLWAGLFLLARELVGEKLIYYDEKIRRPKKITRRNSKNFR